MTLFLTLATFLIAAGGILYEIYLGAFGSYLFGDSVKVFSLTTGVYMFSMGIGAFAIRPSITRPLRKLILTELGLILLHVVSPFLIWYAFTSGGGAAVIFWSVLMISGTFVGTEIPLVLALARDREGSSDQRIHQILAADYVGALCASLAFGFLLLPQVGLIGSAAFAGIIEGLGAIVLIVYARQPGATPLDHRERWPLTAAVVALLIGCGIVLARAQPIQRSLENAWAAATISGAEIFHSEWTGFSHVTVARYDHPLTGSVETSLLLDRQFQWVTGPDLFYYHEMLTVPGVESFRRLTGRLPARALILGGGDGFAAERLHTLYGLREITIIDIDPRIQALATSIPAWRDAGGWIYGDPSVHPIHTDAFSHVIQAAARAIPPDALYDVVIFDLPDPRGAALARFFTPSFFRHLRHLMSPSAQITIQASADADSPRGRISYVCSLQQALGAAGLQSRVLNGDELDHYVMGSLGGFRWPAPNKVLPGRYFKRGVQVAHFLVDSLQWFGEHCPDLPLNSILRPTLLGY